MVANLLLLPDFVKNQQAVYFGPALAPVQQALGRSQACSGNYQKP